MSNANISSADFNSLTLTKGSSLPQRPESLFSSLYGRVSDKTSEVKMLRFFISVLETFKGIYLVPTVSPQTLAEPAGPDVGSIDRPRS
jgi:hypothetical protein